MSSFRKATIPCLFVDANSLYCQENRMQLSWADVHGSLYRPGLGRCQGDTILSSQANHRRFKTIIIHVR